MKYDATFNPATDKFLDIKKHQNVSLDGIPILRGDGESAISYITLQTKASSFHNILEFNS